MGKYSLANTFVKRLSTEALNSTAVNHPYLSALSTGDFPNIELALKDFAFQYSFYSNKFTRYLSVVIDNISSPQHKQTLLNNLAEEKGDTHGVELPADVLASIADQPHTLLYRRFQDALGIDEHYRATTDQCQTSLLWGKQFLQLCKMNECVGVGAVGIGTEFIVSRVYDQILDGLKEHSNLTMNERVFFDLHSQCDEQHAAEFLLITEELARNSSACEQIEYGVNMALNMRTLFWDKMLQRAQNLPASISPTLESFSTVGYQKSL